MDNNTKHKKTKCDYKSTQCLPSSGLEAGGVGVGVRWRGGRWGKEGTRHQLSPVMNRSNVTKHSAWLCQFLWIHLHCTFHQLSTTHDIQLYIYLPPTPTPKALKMHKKAHTRRSFSIVKLVWKYLACWRNWIHQIIQNDDKSTGFNRSVKWNVPCSLHWQPTEMTWWEFTSLWLVG